MLVPFLEPFENLVSLETLAIQVRIRTPATYFSHIQLSLQLAFCFLDEAVEPMLEVRVATPGSEKEPNHLEVRQVHRLELLVLSALWLVLRIDYASFDGGHFLLRVESGSLDGGLWLILSLPQVFPFLDCSSHGPRRKLARALLLSSLMLGSRSPILASEPSTIALLLTFIGLSLNRGQLDYLLFVLSLRPDTPQFFSWQASRRFMVAAKKLLASLRPVVRKGLHRQQIALRRSFLILTAPGFERAKLHEVLGRVRARIKSHVHI